MMNSKKYDSMAGSGALTFDSDMKCCNVVSSCAMQMFKRKHVVQMDKVCGGLQCEE